MFLALASFASLAYYLGFIVSRSVGQAPGDGDPLCTQEIINDMQNPFFANRPTYLPSERPLLDTRDYIALLRDGDDGDGQSTWQSVDNDDNNTASVATKVQFTVKVCCTALIAKQNMEYILH